MVADQIREKRLRVPALKAPSIPELLPALDPELPEMEPGVDPELSSEGGTDTMAPGTNLSLSTAPATTAVPDKYTQLKVLGELRDQGILTETEFQIEKAKILDQG